MQIFSPSRNLKLQHFYRLRVRIRAIDMTRDLILFEAVKQLSIVDASGNNYAS